MTDRVFRAALLGLVIATIAACAAAAPPPTAEAEPVYHSTVESPSYELHLRTDQLEAEEARCRDQGGLWYVYSRAFEDSSIPWRVVCILPNLPAASKSTREPRTGGERSAVLW